MRISDWSSDVCSSDLLPPPKATILSARRISSRGGQTQFASTKAAYEHLADDDKEFLKNLRVIHTVTAAVREFFRPEDLDDARRALRQEHPLIWTRLDGTRSMIIGRSEEHTSELQSLMRISYAVFCLKKKNKTK